ncbi:MAG TPA: hypothetical protein VMW62_14645 [Chloroflexota bacterium]|nr:hypothetical protein [Chloroflexota bacterium]
MVRDAAGWMSSRGWQRLLAKDRDYTQSLYHHTLAEIDVLASLAPALMSDAGWALTAKQFQALFVANLCHDVGKEDPAWQRAVARRGKAPDHVHHESTTAAIEDWAGRLGYDSNCGFSATVAAAIGLHHKATQGVASTLDLLFHGGQVDPRWRELADIVEAVDKTCSAATVTAAAATATVQFAGKLAVSFHRMWLVRGVSTAIFHQAANAAHQDLGWRPLLHFADGTVYGALASDEPAVPSYEVVKDRAGQLFQVLLDQCNVADQVVGNPVADMFPKPELFNASDMPTYLDSAAQRMKTLNFSKKHRKKGGFSKEFLGEAGKEGMLGKYCRLAGACVPTTDAEREEVLLRLATATPLDAMLRFYKSVLFSEKIFSVKRWPQAASPSGSEATRPVKSAFDGWLAKLKTDYDAQLGAGSFSGLQSVTNDPAANLAKAIDPFLRQQVQGEGVSWSSKLAKDQQAELKRRLLDIFDPAISRLPADFLPPPLDGQRLAEAFAADVLLPGEQAPFDVTAHLRAYVSSKNGGQWVFCPWSNEAGIRGQGTSADLGVSTDGHTNRLPMQSNTWKNRGGVSAALGSRYELMLRRLLLGRPPAQLLVLLPPSHLGAAHGQELATAVVSLEQEVMEYSHELSPDPTRRFSFQYTDQVAGKLAAGEQDLVGLLEYDSPKYSVAPKHPGGNAREGFAALDHGLHEAFGAGDQEALDELNAECETPFSSWKDAVEQIYAGRSPDATKALSISEEVSARRRAALRLHEPGRFICRTPNLIFILLPEKIAVGKENAANSAIRQLFLSLVAASTLGVSAALIDPEEALTFTGGEGAVRVPSNAALRAQVARCRNNLRQQGSDVGGGAISDWLLPQEVDVWLKGLLAVHQLARVHDPSDFQRHLFPDSSCLYDILSSRSAGALLRRIETVTKRTATHEMKVLDVLEPFLD